MGRSSRGGQRARADSGRRAGSRARARAPGARGGAGPARRIEMSGAMDAAMIAALELEIRRLARCYGAEIEDFRVTVRRRSG